MTVPARLAARTAAALVLVTGAARGASAQQAVVVTVTVRHAVTGAPIADATVRAMPAGRSCVTTGDGRCRIAVEAAAPVELRATALGFTPSVQSVRPEPHATLAVSFSLHPGAIALDPVVTIGGRTPERTVSTSPVPVDVISSQLLEATGMPETWQQLQRLVPSANVPHIPLGDNHMRPVTLRGLAPHHVLVLVDGKRRHPAAPLLAGPSVPAAAMTDIGAIPSSAIERIEVLRDGAAAQYGSDAIGGVVNIVLRRGERRDLRATAGTVYSVEGGRHFRDGGHVAAAGAWGVEHASGAHLTVSGELRDRNGTNRAYPDRRQQYFADDPRNADSPRVSSHLGDGSMESGLVFLSAAAPVRAGMEAYAFGGASRRDGRTPDAFFRRPSDPRTVRAIHPDGFLPEVASTIDDRSLVTGIRGTTRGWRWDASAGWGGNRIAYDVEGSDNASLGAASPTSFDAGTIATRQWSVNADVSRAIDVLPVPVNVAGGLERRVERYRIGAGEPDSWRDGEVPILDGPQQGQRAPVGAQGMLGFRPVDETFARRGSSAAYVELDVRPVDRLLVQGAGRSERYSDFGSTSVGKLATRVDAGHGIAFRASLSTGFRAPALSQEYFASTRTVLTPVNGVTTVRTIRTFPVNTVEARLMGATPLRPERSVNRSAGLVFDRPRWPLVTLDVYRIDIADRISLVGPVTDTAIVRLLEENGLAGIGGGAFFMNKIDTRTRGVDLVASHVIALGHGRMLRLLAGMNDTRSTVVRVLPPPPQLDRFEPLLFGRTARGIIEDGQPRRTLVVTSTYTAQRLGLTLHNQRSGPTAQLDQLDPAADQVVRARWITDARVSWQLRPRLQVAASVANLFDSYPDEWWDFKDGLQARGTSMQGIFRHPGALSPFGMNGRALYLDVAWR